MRIRFKPYAAPELAACSFYTPAPMEEKGRWNASFSRPQQPLHLELGCGKGGFLAQLACAHPQLNYIGIDLTDKVLVVAKRNVEAHYAAQGQVPDNVKILTHDIERIDFMLGDGDEIHRVYINFCNPWNKKAGHEKHRLTHTRQLLKYRAFLAPTAEIYFKCDDAALFEDSLVYLEEAGFSISWLTRDLHADEPAWNIRTEHEDMYAKQGIAIKALIAVVR